MSIKPDTHPSQLTPEQQTQWHADVAALRDHLDAHTLAPLRMGDLFLELKQRWGRKVSVLARQAGVSPFIARQRARIAQAIPPGSPLRDLGLPFSILRLLAPLADPLPWAEHARALQDRGELRVRRFARLLEEAGLRHRRPRPPRRPHCAQCRHESVDPAARLSLRSGEESVTLCSPRCAAAYFARQATLSPTPIAGTALDAPPLPEAEKRDSISQPPPPGDGKRDSTSQPPPPATPSDRPPDEGFRAALPGGLVVMTRRRPA